jgi:outer membrane protein, heavy metal efflux system
MPTMGLRHPALLPSLHALIVALCAVPAVGQAQSRDERGESETGLRPSAAAIAPQAVADAELAREVRFDTVLRTALARNSDLAEAAARTRAARSATSAAGRLPAPQFAYQLWAAPLARPYALDEAEMHMFGIQQTFPALGSLSARAKAVAAQADVAEQAERARWHDVTQRVRRAYAEYYRADTELRVHEQHATLVRQILELARAAYQSGRTTQQDVLRTTLELTRLHNDLAMLEGERQSARALLNTLMARPIDAPLGPPAGLDSADMQARLEKLERSDVTQRAELLAVNDAIRARQHEIEAARASGRWPEIMVGLQYMLMPMANEPHAYGAMLSFSLPWLTDRYEDEAHAAEASLAAERSSWNSLRDAARHQLSAAAARAKAARASLVIIERDLVPQAQQSFEAAQALYRGGQAESLSIFDAMRSLLEIRIAQERARVVLEFALADMERAVGGLGDGGAVAGRSR